MAMVGDRLREIITKLGEIKRKVGVIVNLIYMLEC